VPLMVYWPYGLYENSKEKEKDKI